MPTRERRLREMEAKRAKVRATLADRTLDDRKRYVWRYAFRSPGDTHWRYRTYVRGTSAWKRYQAMMAKHPRSRHKVERLQVIGEWEQMSRST